MTRLLVVDDSETVLLMLQRRLESVGYEVATATDGREALTAVAGSSPAPDLILLDAMMPNMSGPEALQELRASGDETPVIIVSAYRYGDEPEEALALGADGCIGKPFEWDTLIGEIEKLTA
ncbi:MAG: response regulator [Solirubrobacterales bacterium]